MARMRMTRSRPPSVAVALQNRADEVINMSFTFKKVQQQAFTHTHTHTHTQTHQVSFPFPSALVRDCWALSDIGHVTGSFSASVVPHDTLVFVLSPAVSFSG